MKCESKAEPKVALVACNLEWQRTITMNIKLKRLFYIFVPVKLHSLTPLFLRCLLLLPLPVRSMWWGGKKPSQHPRPTPSSSQRCVVHSHCAGRSGAGPPLDELACRGHVLLVGLAHGVDDAANAGAVVVWRGEGRPRVCVWGEPAGELTLVVVGSFVSCGGVSFFMSGVRWCVNCDECSVCARDCVV